MLLSENPGRNASPNPGLGLRGRYRLRPENPPSLGQTLDRTTNHLPATSGSMPPPRPPKVHVNLPLSGGGKAPSPTPVAGAAEFLRIDGHWLAFPRTNRCKAHGGNRPFET